MSVSAGDMCINHSDEVSASYFSFWLRILNNIHSVLSLVFPATVSLLNLIDGGRRM